MAALNDLVVPGDDDESYDPAKYVLMDGLSQDEVADLVDPPNFNEGLASLAAA